ncbi:cytochrome P450 [Nocardia brasiliensis ATCC] [Mycobacterium shimoidei]|uniref:Cytochrome P450 [Nocardia brasiliensis ATCC] n=1 Tax=Mycobacterium shimoidei TaxID=29313 RepID=A0A375YUA6_MYCSH|nr:cytochrome P450 [Mycobacterium shimoidei]SRX92511.1 cytochrome P450 [Nocardia brasiliensis ATCC] [Mycobacterium shimoidei]
MASTSPTPGPSRRQSLRYWTQILRDPLAVYIALACDYGDAVRIPLTAKHTFFLLSRPEHAEHVLVAHQDHYVKAFTYRPLKAILGDGLLTAEGDTWRRHRRLVQPVFSHRHVQTFAPAVVAAARDRTNRWTPGATINLADEMRTLTMHVIGRVLFGIDLADDAEPIGRAVSRLQSAATAAMLLPNLGSPQRTRWLAAHIIPGLGRATTTLESLVSRIIDARIAAPHTEPSDLLDLLLATEELLSRSEIQDEVMTLVLAGHETTANTLTWALALLSRHPAARDRLVAEVDEVIGDGDPQATDMESLVWTQAVVSETMRLYPPAWTIERDAVVADNIAGVEVSPGDTVAISPYLLHHHSEFWPNPEGFDPRRFMPDQHHPRYAFIPFGGGRRICVGAGLAQLEATIALATLSQAVRLDLVPGTVVRPRADITLHPRGPVTMTVAPPVRAAHAAAEPLTVG